MDKKVIVTGSCETEERALDWLRTHGAEVSQSSQSVTIVILPEDAILEKLAFHWQYALSFENQKDASYVVVDLDVDACKTVLKLDSVEENLVDEDWLMMSVGRG